eukprot:m.310743 g.310743  ORF g.310743 m.310743 type:complete len:135 (+) comp54378_c0_seq1:93-497(+)
MELVQTGADVASLTEGTLAHFLPDVNRIKAALTEPSSNQETLISQLKQEIGRLEEGGDSVREIASVLSRVPRYREKLEGVRREMHYLHERAAHLKKRAKKLVEQRRRDDEDRLKALEKEKRREKLLEAKPAAGK